MDKISLTYDKGKQGKGWGWTLRWQLSDYLIRLPAFARQLVGDFYTGGDVHRYKFGCLDIPISEYARLQAELAEDMFYVYEQYGHMVCSLHRPRLDELFETYKPVEGSQAICLCVAGQAHPELLTEPEVFGDTSEEEGDI